MTNKTYDLINLDEGEIVSILKALVKSDNFKLAFTLAYRAFSDCTADEVYNYIESIKIELNKENKQ